MDAKNTEELQKKLKEIQRAFLKKKKKLQKYERSAQAKAHVQRTLQEQANLQVTAATRDITGGHVHSQLPSTPDQAHLRKEEGEDGDCLVISPVCVRKHGQHQNRLSLGGPRQCRDVASPDHKRKRHSFPLLEKCDYVGSPVNSDTKNLHQVKQSSGNKTDHLSVDITRNIVKATSDIAIKAKESPVAIEESMHTRQNPDEHFRTERKNDVRKVKYQTKNYVTHTKNSSSYVPAAKSSGCYLQQNSIDKGQNSVRVSANICDKVDSRIKSEDSVKVTSKLHNKGIPDMNEAQVIVYERNVNEPSVRKKLENIKDIDLGNEHTNKSINCRSSDSKQTEENSADVNSKNSWNDNNEKQLENLSENLLFSSQSSSIQVTSGDSLDSDTVEKLGIRRRSYPRKRRSSNYGQQRQSSRIALKSSQDDSFNSSQSCSVPSLRFGCQVNKAKKNVIISSLFHCLIDEVKRNNKIEEFSIPHDLLAGHSITSINNNMTEADANKDKAASVPFESQTSDIVTDKSVSDVTKRDDTISDKSDLVGYKTRIDGKTKQNLIGDNVNGNKPTTEVTPLKVSIQDNCLGTPDQEAQMCAISSPQLFDSQACVPTCQDGASEAEENSELFSVLDECQKQISGAQDEPAQTADKDPEFSVCSDITAPEMNLRFSNELHGEHSYLEIQHGHIDVRDKELNTVASEEIKENLREVHMGMGKIVPSKDSSEDSENNHVAESDECVRDVIMHDENIHSSCLIQQGNFQIPRQETLVSMVIIEVTNGDTSCVYIMCLCTTSLRLYKEGREISECICQHKLTKSIRKNSGSRLHVLPARGEVCVLLLETSTNSTKLTQYCYTAQGIMGQVVDNIWARKVSVCGLNSGCVIVSSFSQETSLLAKYEQDLGEVTWSHQQLESCRDQIVSLVKIGGIPSALVGLSTTGNLYIWNHERGVLLSTIDISDVCPRDTVCPAVVSEQGFLFLPVLSRRKCHEPGSIVVVNPAMGSCENLFSLQTSGQSWTGCSGFSLLCSDMIMVRDTSGCVYLWDMYTGSCLATLNDVNITCCSSANENIAVAHKHCVHVYKYSASGQC